MKRLKTISLVLGFLVAFSVSACGSFSKTLSDGLYVYEYLKEQKAYAIKDTEYNDETKLTIPSKYNDKPVVALSDYALSNNASVESIEIPDSITSIGDGAFLSCKSLTDINIPNSVTSFGKKVFLGCANLQTATLGSGVKSIGKSCFLNCNSLT